MFNLASLSRGSTEIKLRLTNCYVCLLIIFLNINSVGAENVGNCGLLSVSGAPKTIAEINELRRISDGEAAYRLALAYSVGTLVSRDCNQVKSLLERATVSSYPAAENALGELLYSTAAVASKEERRAAKLFADAAKANNPAAQYNLGRVIVEKRANGYGSVAQPGANPAFYFEDDLQTSDASSSNPFTLAAIWWTRSAESGNGLAMDALAELYENGRGVPRDISKAEKLYETAVTAGVPGAQKKLDMLRETNRH